jgi:hypothetical protein
MERYKTKREVIQDFQQQLMELERSLLTINSSEAEKLQSVQILQGRIRNLENEIKEQQTKTDRAKKAIIRSSQDYRRKAGVESNHPLPEEEDFIVRKAKELGTITLTEVSKVAEGNPELNAVLSSVLEEVIEY